MNGSVIIGEPDHSSSGPDAVPSAPVSISTADPLVKIDQAGRRSTVDTPEVGLEPVGSDSVVSPLGWPSAPSTPYFGEIKVTSVTPGSRPTAVR